MEVIVTGSLSLALARRRTSLWGVLALLAALLTGLAVYSYLSWVRSQIPVAGRLVPMVVAAHDVGPGTTLAVGDLRVVQHPEKYLPELALQDADAVIGKVAAVPIFEGEPITSRKLGPTGGLSALIPQGTRAYSLTAQSGASIGFLPRVGDRVDVIATFPREVMGQPTSITILRSKEVAAVSEPGSSGDVADRLGIEAAGAGLTVTLFVTPEEAEKLAMAEALGRITLVLAPEGDPSEEAPAPITPQELTGR